MKPLAFTLSLHSPGTVGVLRAITQVERENAILAWED